MSNVIDLSARREARVLPSEDARPWTARRGRKRMHRFVFRSYNLIVQSAEADLMRDVCLDIHKAQTKLTAIRRQLQRDRELADARIGLLTSAESRLSAAIVAARSLKERNQ
jgi:cell division FtsZ-interacting protein ZapD